MGGGEGNRIATDSLIAPMSRDGVGAPRGARWWRRADFLRSVASAHSAGPVPFSALRAHDPHVESPHEDIPSHVGISSTGAPSGRCRTAPDPAGSARSAGSGSSVVPGSRGQYMRGCALALVVGQPWRAVTGRVSRGHADRALWRQQSTAPGWVDP